jgi:mono/diheme cytochrome c family protein
MDMPKSSAVQRFAVCALTTWLAGLACTSVSARDDVPDDVKAMKNPVALEESEIRYYQRQFKGKCSRCHGLDGTGAGVDATPGEGLVRPANFTDAKYMASRTDGQLFYQILMGGGERCAMPAFGPESDHAWAEDKIWHMVAFIRRFSDASNR